MVNVPPDKDIPKFENSAPVGGKASFTAHFIPVASASSRVKTNPSVDFASLLKLVPS